MFVSRLAIAAAALCLGAAALPAPAAAQSLCSGDVACVLPSGDQYYVETPEGWTEQDSLPVVMWFHGWQGSGAGVMRNRSLVEGFTDAGFVFVAGDGLNRTWAHQGSPSQARDDLAYVTEVMAAVTERFPVDPEQTLAAGFSQGGSMVWDVACNLPGAFLAYAPVSGAFWRPHPTDCPAAPVNLRHVHGTSDTVVPMTGRAIRGGLWNQGDVREGLPLFLEPAQCPAEADLVQPVGDLTCEIWTGCGTGHSVQLCLHDGGHMVPRGWREQTLEWFASLPRSTDS